MTYFILPFLRSPEGKLITGMPVEAATAIEAVRKAEAVAARAAGAVVYEHRRDPETGVMQHIALQSFGAIAA